MSNGTPDRRSAEIFKNLINDGQVEQPVPVAVALPKAPQPFVMPAFDELTASADSETGAGASPPENEPGPQEPDPQPFPLPSLGADEEISPDRKVRKYAQIKEKIFLPLITDDEDEDPVQAVKRELDIMRAQAKAQAEEMLNNAEQTLQNAEAAARSREEESSRLRNEAEEILQQARNDAPRILQEAKEEGFNSGYKDGEDQGLMAGKARVEALILDFAAVVKKTGQIRGHVLAAMEEELTGLLEACLDRFFLAANSVDASLTSRIIKELISRLDSDERITVRLNPGNMEQMARLAPEIWRELKNLPKASFVADANLHAGDCIIDTPITQIDATVATRRERIFRLLEGMAKQNSISGVNLEQILNRAKEELAEEVSPPQAIGAAPTTEDDPQNDDSWNDESWNEPAGAGQATAPAGEGDW
ncbi:MAG: hypothetical protein LBJ14_09635 [Desulfarculales bacterium]|nr:hypothetical protein [Desulfarculales bacterium]